MTMISGLVSGRRRATSTASSRASYDDPKDGGDEDTTVVEPDQGNVLSHIISQLRPGADLSRVTLPTFILEPRSMLERITNFMCHPELLLPIPDIDDPVERFVSVVKFYLSGWHIRPPGVKKPLNPILGEIFSCYWNLPDDTKAYYISEQTSHHPPKSSYFYLVPEHHIRVDGCLKPRSKFLGNSAASLMEGTTVLTFLNRGKDPHKGERYHLTQPNMYARGILFGKMKYELGDHSVVRCPETGLVADLEFKTKGWVGGTYNAIGGTVKNESTGEVLYEFSGLWSDEMFVKDLKTGHKEMFFNAHRSRPSPPQVRPLEEQDERESQALWHRTSQAVKERNHELATDEKTKVEDAQRDEAAKRAQDGIEWHPRLFRRVQGGPGGPEEGEEDLEWIINAYIEGRDPKQLTKQVLSIYPILQGQQAHGGNAIPSRSAEIQASESSAAPSSSPNPSTSTRHDLIDLGPDNAASEPLQPQRPAAVANSAVESTGEISGLLKSTGKPAEGPLLGFAHDLKDSVPEIRDLSTTGTRGNPVDEKE